MKEKLVEELIGVNASGDRGYFSEEEEEIKAIRVKESRESRVEPVEQC